MNRIFYIAITALFFAACSNNKEQKKDAPDTSVSTPADIAYTVVARHPHDTTSFTEGLVVHNGRLFESTGHTENYPKSRSLFGVLDTATGKITAKAEIDKDKYFGEGIVFFNDKIYQLTLDNKTGFIYDAGTVKKLGEFHYEGKGWALTTDGTRIIMSDGSSNIVYRDPISFAPVKTLNVTDNNGPVSNINELEFISGFIYANQWLTDYIIKIDTSSGKVLARIDLSVLKKQALAAYPGAIETNGIAFDAATDNIFITGKLWPFIYQIKFAH